MGLTSRNKGKQGEREAATAISQLFGVECRPRKGSSRPKTARRDGVPERKSR